MLKITYRPSGEVERKAVDAAERVGKRFGSFVYTTARRSIRKPGKSGKPSKPGDPPKNVSGALKNFIRFAYDKVTRSVVIGPTLLPGRTDAQEVLEKGGRAKRRIRDGATVRTKSIDYQSRPYMVPALEKRLPDLAGLWDGSIK